MVTQVVRHGPAVVEQFVDLGVDDVAGHDEGSGERQAGLDRVLRELGADGFHGLVEVDRHDVAREVIVGHLGQEAGRVLLELFEEHAVGGDLAECLTVGRARHGDADRVGCPVAGEAHNPDVVAEVLAAELCADAEPAGEFEHALLPLGVAEGVAGLAAGGGQVVEVVGRGVLGDLEVELGRRAADDDCQVVRRAGGGAERAEFLVEEGGEPLGGEQRPGLLEQVALVGRAPALGHEQEPVGVARDGLDFDLGRQVRAGVLFGEHVERCHLRVAQVRREEGVEHAPRDGLLVVSVREDLLALLGGDDGGAGVLARRQHAAGGDVGVVEQFGGYEAVVGRGLRIIEDRRQLCQVAGPQQVGDVAHGGRREEADGLVVDLEERAPARSLDGANPLGGEQPEVGGGVGVVEQRQQVGVGELGGVAHGSNLTVAGWHHWGVVCRASSAQAARSATIGVQKSAP